MKQVLYGRDSREKEGEGWIWLPEKKKNKLECLGTKIQCLKSGDYTVNVNGVDYSDIIIIERKNSLGELYGNLINKENRERFEDELERLRPVKHKYLFIEANLSKDIMGMSLVQYKGFGPPVSKIIDMVHNYSLDFGIEPWFVGDAGQKTATKIFENIIRKYT